MGAAVPSSSTPIRTLAKLPGRSDGAEGKLVSSLSRKQYRAQQGALSILQSDFSLLGETWMKHTMNAEDIQKRIDARFFPNNVTFDHLAQCQCFVGSKEANCFSLPLGGGPICEIINDLIDDNQHCHYEFFDNIPESQQPVCNIKEGHTKVTIKHERVFKEKAQKAKVAAEAHSKAAELVSKEKTSKEQAKKETAVK